MTKLKFIFIALLITTLRGCVGQSVGYSPSVFLKDSTIHIDLDNLPYGEPLPFDSLYYGYDFVVNEVGANFTTSSWSTTYFDGEQNFLEGNLLNSSVCIYDTLGNLVRRINEEEGYFGFSFDTPNRFIYTLNIHNSVIRRYGYDGRLHNVIPVETGQRADNTKGALCDRVAVTPEGNLLIHYAYWGGNREYNFGLMDSLGNIITTKKTMGGFCGKTRPVVVESFSYIYEDYLHVYDLSDTVFVIKNSRFIPKYVFTQTNPMKKMIKKYGNNVDINSIKEKVYRLSTLQENDRYLFFSFRTSNPPKNTYLGADWKGGYYDKQTGEAFITFGVYHMPHYTADSIGVSCVLIPPRGRMSLSGNEKGKIKLYPR